MNPTAEQLRAAGWVEYRPGKWAKLDLGAGGGVATGVQQPTPQETRRELANGQSVKRDDEPPARTVKRLRQSSKPLLNRLEQEWFDWLNRNEPSDYLPQAIRFKLANGLWYKPDVVCFHLQMCWEVKGPKSWRGGFENLKMAASKYPWFRWKLIWKQDGQWQEQEILP